MAAGLSAATALKPYTPFPLAKATQTLFFSPLTTRFRHGTDTVLIRTLPRRTTTGFTVCVLMEDPKQSTQIITEEEEEPLVNRANPQLVSPRVANRLARKRSERFNYLVAALMSSFAVTSLAVFAVYYRFSWQMQVHFYTSQLS